MTEQDATSVVPEESSGDQLLAILLVMAMFVLVVDTSLMNVSISAVVHDLDTSPSEGSAKARQMRHFLFSGSCDSYSPSQ